MYRAEAIEFAKEQQEIFGGKMGEFLEFVETELSSAKDTNVPNKDAAKPTQTNTSNTLNALEHDDLIRRAEVIEWYCKWECNSKYCGIPCREVEEMQGLPSAERRGKWVITEVYGITIAECSECKRTMPTPINKNGTTPFRYCPYCGCEMRGKDE